MEMVCPGPRMSLKCTPSNSLMQPSANQSDTSKLAFKYVEFTESPSYLATDKIEGHGAGRLVSQLGQHYEVANECALSQVGTHPGMTLDVART